MGIALLRCATTSLTADKGQTRGAPRPSSNLGASCGNQTARRWSKLDLWEAWSCWATQTDCLETYIKNSDDAIRRALKNCRPPGGAPKV